MAGAFEELLNEAFGASEGLHSFTGGRLGGSGNLGEVVEQYIVYWFSWYC